ncbi:MAG TPA: hypothetical protein VHM48_01250 [Candidatus Limnocylindrales bacterium]|nr:hypothetical protein [Candidatus Limnocylindrales bacterium]
MNALDLEMDRRRFLALLGSLTAAGALAGCGSQDVSPRPAATAASAPPSHGPVGPYDVLRRLQAIIRQSPDHLGSLAAAAVATGDPAAIVRFVQEHVAVLPSTARNADPTTDVRWGQRAALRSGAGTLRERADLIVDLLRQAGIEGRVVTVPRPSPDPAGSREVPAFAPDPVAIAALWDPIDPTHPPVGGADDGAGSRADTATERLLAALPIELRNARLVGPALPETIPAVEFQHDGGTRWATGLGREPLLSASPDGLLNASAVVVPRVSVAVSVALNPPTGATIDRTVLHEVLRGEWTADQVAGRQLVLGFAAPGSAVDTLGQDLAAATIRRPVLRLMAGEPLGDAVPGVTGTYLSTAGGLIEGSPDDPSRVIGPLGPLLAPTAGGAVGSSVAALEGTIVAATFPEVELRLQAWQADGSPVHGLTAGDFRVSEDGAARAVTVIANSRPADTRVLVVYDTSGSVTDFWSSPARRTAFESTVVKAVGDAAAAHPFVVQVIGVGDVARDDRWAAPDPTALAAAFGAVASNSDVWLTLGRAVPASGAAAVLLVSDNEASDVAADIPAFRRALRASGVPVACLPVGTVNKATTDLILADGGGPRFSPTAPDLAAMLGAFIGSRVAAAGATNYRVRYGAPAAGPAQRAVVVAIAGSAVAGLKLTYTVPAEADRAAPPGIAGVYLTIRVGDRESRRRLGGVRVSDRGTPADTADAAAIGDAMAAINGIHTISFEPASSTTAHLLDDVIGAALSAEPIAAAWDRGPAAIAAASAGWRRVPATLAWLADAVTPGSGGSAIADGLRVTILTERFGPDGLTQLSDVVPALNRAVGSESDPAAAFRSALRATIGASIRESEVFGASAADLLGSLDLVAIPALESAASVSAWSPEQRARLAPMIEEYADFHRLLPASGDIAAMWVVDPDTGSATAVGADGRGAGSALPDCLTPADTNQASAFISVSIALISAACLAIGAEEPSFGCVGADVFGAVSAGLAVFTAPPDIPGSAFGAFSYGAGLAAANVGSAAGRTIISVLLLIAGLLVGGKC